ncbi:MAG TPA: hypothetical protein VG939_18705, partial [Caulobacteraceae bacterium]|nr:hypothetical protein [Caulobacteraceae bacterium]
MAVPVLMRAGFGVVVWLAGVSPAAMAGCAAGPPGSAADVRALMLSASPEGGIALGGGGPVRVRLMRPDGAAAEAA